MLRTDRFTNPNPDLGDLLQIIVGYFSASEEIWKISRMFLLGLCPAPFQRKILSADKQTNKHHLLIQHCHKWPPTPAQACPQLSPVFLFSHIWKQSAKMREPIFHWGEMKWRAANLVSWCLFSSLTDCIQLCWDFMELKRRVKTTAVNSRWRCGRSSSSTIFKWNNNWTLVLLSNQLLSHWPVCAKSLCCHQFVLKVGICGW